MGSNIYTDEPSGAESKSLKEEIRSSSRQVEDFFHSPLPPVHILVCSTERCYRRVEGNGGISKAISWAGRALLLSPRGQNTTIVAHELTHIELYHLLGALGYLKLPAWFDEGLAVYVSDDRRYLAPTGSNTRCLVSGSDTLPARDWEDVMHHNPARAYGLAACRVSNWLSSRGGPQVVGKLIGSLKRGESFEKAYGS